MEHVFKNSEVEINKTITKITKIISFLDDYLNATNGYQQRKEHEHFIYLFTKIRFNLDSILLVLNKLFHDSRFKVSLNVLFRSIIDDLININYLLCFVVTDDLDQKSLDNELNILHKEFLLSIEELLIAERDIQNIFKFSSQNSTKNDAEYEEAIDRLYIDNSYLKEEGVERKWKKNSKIRETTNPNIIRDFPDKLKSQNPYISEGAKLSFIKARNFTNADLLKHSFKYFSQFQHYSPIAHKLLSDDIMYDLKYFERTLITLLQTVSTCSQTLITPDKVNIQRIS